MGALGIEMSEMSALGIEISALGPFGGPPLETYEFLQESIGSQRGAGKRSGNGLETRFSWPCWNHGKHTLLLCKPPSGPPDFQQKRLRRAGKSIPLGKGGNSPRFLPAPAAPLVCAEKRPQQFWPTGLTGSRNSCPICIIHGVSLT